jgi:hypothetical protein
VSRVTWKLFLVKSTIPHLTNNRVEHTNDCGNGGGEVAKAREKLANGDVEGEQRVYGNLRHRREQW